MVENKLAISVKVTEKKAGFGIQDLKIMHACNDENDRKITSKVGHLAKFLREKVNPKFQHGSKVCYLGIVFTPSLEFFLNRNHLV